MRYVTLDLATPKLSVSNLEYGSAYINRPYIGQAFVSVQMQVEVCAVIGSLVEKTLYQSELNPLNRNQINAQPKDTPRQLQILRGGWPPP